MKKGWIVLIAGIIFGILLGVKTTKENKEFQRQEIEKLDSLHRWRMDSIEVFG